MFHVEHSSRHGRCFVEQAMSQVTESSSKLFHENHLGER